MPENVTDEATSGGNGLAVTFDGGERNSLPKLRFGVPYRLPGAHRRSRRGTASIRTIHRSRHDPNATLPVAFWRFEPVDPPALVHRARTSEGESLERMVIRSNWNADTNAYLTTAKFLAARSLPASADFEYTAVNERHAVPPKSSQLQCEQHGLFDAMFANPAGIKTGLQHCRP